MPSAAASDDLVLEGMAGEHRVADLDVDLDLVLQPVAP